MDNSPYSSRYKGQSDACDIAESPPPPRDVDDGALTTRLLRGLVNAGMQLIGYVDVFDVYVCETVLCSILRCNGQGVRLPKDV